MDTHQWLLKRNCSLTPGQLALAYAVLFFLSFSIATTFALRGAWHVLTFAMCEMAGVALAFLHYARHATDYEHIALIEGCLLIERVLAGRTEQTRLDPYYTRIDIPQDARKLIRLEARGVKVEVGRFVAEAKRRQFARELRMELQTNLRR